MSLSAAMEAMRGQPYQAILSALRLQTEPAIGKIQGSQLKLLQSFIGGTGLRNRLANATPEQASSAAAVTEAIQPAYLAREDSYSINLADPDVAQLLTDAVSAGVLTPDEKAYLVQLATYQKTLWPNATLHDVIAHFEPELIDGQWHELPSTSAHLLVLRLTNPLPEETMIEIEIQDQYPDGSVSDWYPNNALYGVHKAKHYRHGLQNNDCPRKVRWKCEYVITGTVSVE